MEKEEEEEEESNEAFIYEAQPTQTPQNGLCSKVGQWLIYLYVFFVSETVLD